MTRSPTLALIALVLSLAPFTPDARAMVVSQLDLTGGRVFDSRFPRIVDRLFDQDGTLLMGRYQPLPEIVPPVERNGKTFSLFTSGVHGAPAPSATISGSSITVDLSSLFIGVNQGDSLRAWHIGGLATGLVDPETLEFCISWEHLFDRRGRDRSATFFLQGRVEFAPEPVPIPAGLALFATGLAGLATWIRYSAMGARLARQA